jgi:1,4-alpha-glucan branching enzyme
VLLNATPVPRSAIASACRPVHRVTWRSFNSDSRYYGGSDLGNPAPMTGTSGGVHGLSVSIEITLPPLAGIVLLPS